MTNDLAELYAGFVKAGVKLDPDTTRERGLLGATGLGGEAGEVIDHIKKLTWHNKPLDREAFILELGDVLWYYTLLLETFGISYTEVMTMNIYKLVARYPEKHPHGKELMAYASRKLSQETMAKLKAGGHLRVQNDRFGDDLGPAFPDTLDGDFQDGTPGVQVMDGEDNA